MTADSKDNKDVHRQLLKYAEDVASLYKHQKKGDSLAQRQLVKYAGDVSELYKRLKQENALLAEANQELEENYYQTFLMGFDLMSLHNDFMSGHCKRVAFHSRNLARALNSGEQVETRVKLSALLHDIGLIGFSKLTLTRLFGGTERDETVLKIYSQHTIVDVRPLTSTEKYKAIAGIIRSHHENVDGSGFPDGLKGHDIPLESRIIAITNDYDKKRLISSKQVKPAATIAQMQADVGRKYDVELFEVFARSIPGTDRFVAVKSIGLDNLKPGMILAEAIQSDDGLKLISSNTELTDHHIKKLKEFQHQIIIRLPITVYK